MSFYPEPDIPYLLNLPKSANKIIWEKEDSKSENRQSLLWTTNTKLDANIEETVMLRLELAKFVGGHRLSMNLFSNQMLVERADFKPGGWHKNKLTDKKRVTAGHKHKVTEVHQDNHAFKPKDVSDWTKPVQTIKDVLKEWNINIDESIDIPNEFWQSDVNDYL